MREVALVMVEHRDRSIPDLCIGIFERRDPRVQDLILEFKRGNGEYKNERAMYMMTATFFSEQK